MKKVVAVGDTSLWSQRRCLKPGQDETLINEEVQSLRPEVVRGQERSLSKEMVSNATRAQEGQERER